MENVLTARNHIISYTDRLIREISQISMWFARPESTADVRKRGRKWISDAKQHCTGVQMSGHDKNIREGGFTGDWTTIGGVDRCDMRVRPRELNLVRTIRTTGVSRAHG